jgi:hypothetical protein
MIGKKTSVRNPGLLFVTRIRNSPSVPGIFHTIINNLTRLSTEQSSIPGVPKVLDIFVITILGIYLVFYLIHAIQCIIYPFQLDFGEGYVLYYANAIAKGNTIYPDISNYPFIPGLYPPVYPLLCAPWVKLFGLSFIPGRMISVISALLIGIVIYKIVSHVSNRHTAIIASLFFLASPYVFLTTVWYRVDTLGLLFSLIGVLFVVKHTDDRVVYLSIPFFLLAVFTKQSFLVAPISSIIYLLFKNRKLAVQIGAFFGISTGGLFILVNYFTYGQLYHHLITLQSFAPVFQLVIQKYGDFISSHLVEYILALALVIVILLQKKWDLLPLYFIITAIAAITVGRPGANVNYFLELIAVCSILTGLAYYKFQQQIQKGTLAGLLITSLVLIQLAMFIHGPYEPLSEDYKDRTQLSTIIKSTSGDVLCEDADLAILNGKKLYIEWFMATQLSSQGKWDQSLFVSDLQNKKFSMIILENDAFTTYKLITIQDGEKLRQQQKVMSYELRYTAQMLDAIINNYHIVVEIGLFHVYQPNE